MFFVAKHRPLACFALTALSVPITGITAIAQSERGCLRLLQAQLPAQTSPTPRLPICQTSLPFFGLPENDLTNGAFQQKESHPLWQLPHVETRKFMSHIRIDMKRTPLCRSSLM